MLRVWSLVLALCAIAAPLGAAWSEARVKDITSVRGVRANQLVGMGLVVGLKGTGDSLRNSPFTEQAMLAMLERLGQNIRGLDMRTRNVAAVMVTAELPAFAVGGNRIDVNVASLRMRRRSPRTLVMTRCRAPTTHLRGGAGSVVIAGFQARARTKRSRMACRRQAGSWRARS